MRLYLVLVVALLSADGSGPTPRAAWKSGSVGRGAARKASRAKPSALATHSVKVSLPGSPPIDVSVCEVVDRAWWERESERAGSNPYGAKLWPGSLAVAQLLARLPAERLGELRVLELGCGNGLISLTAAARGATAIATDLSSFALSLTGKAAASQGLHVEGLVLDLSSVEGAAPGA